MGAKGLTKEEAYLALLEGKIIGKVSDLTGPIVGSNDHYKFVDGAVRLGPSFVFRGYDWRDGFYNYTWAIVGEASPLLKTLKTVICDPKKAEEVAKALEVTFELKEK